MLLRRSSIAAALRSASLAELTALGVGAAAVAETASCGAGVAPAVGRPFEETYREYAAVSTTNSAATIAPAITSRLEPRRTAAAGGVGSLAGDEPSVGAEDASSSRTTG